MECIDASTKVTMGTLHASTAAMPCQCQTHVSHMLYT
jgi:hypothetical protein